jgi:phosphate transport system substrate-binding protein
MKENEHAVSPIVATLVLIVVAVVGAVAVGTIMGTFSSDVSKENNAGDVASASATEILVGGSTTVQPASDAIAKEYMKEHPGIKISVQGGGSDAGIAGAYMGTLDIGAASKNIPDDQKYKDLKSYKIGGSAVCVITNDNAAFNITSKALADMYDLADSDGKVAITITGGNVTAVGSGTSYTIYQRSEGSGTEETFAEFLDKASSGTDFKTPKNVDASKAIGKTGNAGVFDAVKSSTPPALGFVDYGFAVSGTTPNGVSILGVSADDAVTPNASAKFTPKVDKTGSISTINTAILNSLKGLTKFPADTGASGLDTTKKELTRPLNYITNGEPSSVIKNYINFAMSPGAKELINSVGCFSITEFA